MLGCGDSYLGQAVGGKVLCGEGSGCPVGQQVGMSQQRTQVA